MAKLKYAGIDYQLASDTDLDAVRARVAEILRGDSTSPWLEVRGTTGGTFSLLVTPGTPVAISDPTLRKVSERSASVM